MARALLTRSQRQILDLAVDGLNTGEIADELGVDQSSVAACLGRARDRMGVRNNMELVARAIVLGLVKVPLRRQPRKRR